MALPLQKIFPKTISLLILMNRFLMTFGLEFMTGITKNTDGGTPENIGKETIGSLRKKPK